MIDPHTADGVKVGTEHRESGVPLLCLETALPAKFAATLREALDQDVPMPPGFSDLEKLPQRVEVLGPDASLVKKFIVRHCAS
jgi:threonine synthase